MSLSPLVSFKSRFLTYLLNFPRIYANKSKFVRHLLDNKHSIGPIENIMDVIHTTSKGKMLDTMEKFYTYKETRINNQINDKCTVKPNVQKKPRRTHEYRPAYLNRKCTHILIINSVNTVLRSTKVAIIITEPPMQYIQRAARQYTDTQSPKKLTQSLNIQAFTN